jgi:hypothetical protein
MSLGRLHDREARECAVDKAYELDSAEDKSDGLGYNADSMQGTSASRARCVLCLF